MLAYISSVIFIIYTNLSCKTQLKIFTISSIIELYWKQMYSIIPSINIYWVSNICESHASYHGDMKDKLDTIPTL